MTPCLKSGRTTLKKPCVLPAALSVTTTSANMRCLHRLCSKAEALEASGEEFALTDIFLLPK